jgi:uncharacterized membrane protein YqiK
LELILKINKFQAKNQTLQAKVEILEFQAKNQTLQTKVEILELKAEIHALKENAEQQANYQQVYSIVSAN